MYIAHHERESVIIMIVVILQDALNLSRQQIQELMALRRIFLPKMGQLLKDRQRISRALQDSQVPFTPPFSWLPLPLLALCWLPAWFPSLPPFLAHPPALCLCLPSVGSLHGVLHLPFPGLQCALCLCLPSAGSLHALYLCFLYILHPYCLPLAWPSLAYCLLLSCQLFALLPAFACPLHHLFACFCLSGGCA